MKLLENKTFGALHLKNAMVMAAMTRSRAGVGGVPTDLMRQYYEQRSSAGLIITEATNISEDAIGSPYTPGIYSEEQIKAWKDITEAVHKNNAKIVCQLWHTGRVAHSVDRNGKLPFAPSAIAIQNGQQFTSKGLLDYETPKELSLQEIKKIIQDYKQAALNAMEAGFDGVELHAANGYLPHQFFSDSANKREDEYGGSIENKAKFTLEILQELIQAIGSNHVGIKISPFQPYADIYFDDPLASFSYLIDKINSLDLAFVEYMKRNFMKPELPHYPKEDEIELLATKIKTNVIANAGYTKQTAEKELQKNIANAISFGVLFLSNPDLPTRFELDQSLNTPDPQTFFGGDQKGYTDYPFLKT